MPREGQKPKKPTLADHLALRRLKEAIGEALMRWQHVETALFIIAHSLMGADYAINSITFFHIKSAESKLSVTDKLISHCLDNKTYYEFWKPIKKEIQNLITFRNSLAHFDGFFVEPGIIESYPSPFPIGIAPHHLDAFANRGGMVKALTVELIEHGSRELQQTTNILLAFARAHMAPKIDDLPPPMRAWWNGEKIFE